MNSDPLRNADDLLSRIREMEDRGQLSEAIALAREAGTTFSGVYDWSAEVARLEVEGKLARPYREGVEALSEGDTDDAVRLLAWVAAKAPRYREVARYLFWAVEGRDPQVAPMSDADEPPPSLLRNGPSPWGAPGVWLVLFLVAAAAFGAGWALSPGADAPELVAAEASPPEPKPAETPPTIEAPAPSPAAEPPAAVVAPAAAPVEAAAPAAPVAEKPARTRSSSAPAEPAAPTADEAATNCQNGNAKACFKLGDDYYFGRGTPRDLAGAARFYGRACDLRDARGCYNAGDMADKGEAGARDKSKAMTLFGRGCDLGDAQSCSRKGFLEVETTVTP